MRYNNFLKNLDIHTTLSGKGRGVRCNFALYVYPKGHANIYCLDDKGNWFKEKKRDVCTPINNELETIDTFIDILYAMRKKARRLRKNKSSKKSR